MMLVLYKIFIRLYFITVYCVAPFNTKAKQWLIGRKNVWTQLDNVNFKNKKTVWFHIASLGEYEQAAPLLQKLKQAHPTHFFIITFFSPSGYNKISKSSFADVVFYLPLDTHKNMNKIISIVQPQLVIIVKYEFWFYLLKGLHDKKIPIVLVAAIFFKHQIFFKWYGKLHRHMLQFFSVINVQNFESQQLLKTILPSLNVVLAGDTRFERVVQHYENMKHQTSQLEWVVKFIQKNDVIIVGSSWAKDEEMFAEIQHSLNNAKLIIVPHEIKTQKIKTLQQQFENCILYTEINDQTILENYDCVIINAIGLLSKIYLYADIVYVGGGFNRSGIHNILEPAVFGKAIIIGPRFFKFNEAIVLEKLKAIFTIKNSEMLLKRIKLLQNNDTLKKEIGQQCKNYVNINTGASDIIINHIYKNRLLIN